MLTTLDSGLFSAWWWAGCLALFPAFYLGLYLFTIHAKRKYNIEVTSRDVLAMIGVAMRLRIGQTAREITTAQTIKPLAFLAIGLSIGIPIGWAMHQPSEIKTLNNVLILKVRPDKTMRVSADNVQNFETMTCESNDFQKGEKFHYWRYHKQQGCKQMIGQGLGFQAFTDEVSGNRIIFPTPEETADAR